MEAKQKFEDGYGRNYTNSHSGISLNAILQCLKAIKEILEFKYTETKAQLMNDRLLKCIGKLQKTAPVYVSFPPIQYIPNLIQYEKGEQADAHEFLIAVMNDANKTTKNQFQSLMTFDIKCSTCDHTSNRSNIMQDISLQIKKDIDLTVEDSLQTLFQPETLEGDNSYRCEH